MTDLFEFFSYLSRETRKRFVPVVFVSRRTSAPIQRYSPSDPAPTTGRKGGRSSEPNRIDVPGQALVGRKAKVERKKIELVEPTGNGESRGGLRREG